MGLLDKFIKPNYIKMVNYNITNEQYQEALKNIEMGLKEDPLKNGELLLIKGEICAGFAQHERALYAVNKFLEFYPENEPGSWFKMNILIEMARYDEAIIPCEKCITLTPKQDPYVVMLLLIKASLLSYVGRHKQSIDILEEIIRIDTKRIKDNYATDLTSARQLVSLGEFIKAKKIYEDIVLFPKRISATFDHALKQANSGELVGALTTIRILLIYQLESIQFWRLKALILMKLGFYDGATLAHQKALTMCQLLLSLKPNDLYGLTNKGDILMNLGQYEDAIESYQRALEIEPNNGDVISNMAIARTCLGEKGRQTYIVIGIPGFRLN